MTRDMKIGNTSDLMFRVRNIALKIPKRTLGLENGSTSRAALGFSGEI